MDEIGEMLTEAQANLLRILQDGIVEGVGSIQGKEVDVLNGNSKISSNGQ